MSYIAPLHHGWPPIDVAALAEEETKVEKREKLREGKMNAKEELLKHANGRILKCAEITIDIYGKDPVTEALKCGWTFGDYEAFLNALDVEYYDGYGGQALFGILWWNDGVTWSERGEYDGSEWWEDRAIPEIPETLL